MARIGKIKFKSGGEIKVLPQSRNNYNRICLGWGEVVFRAYDNKKLTTSDIHYMADAAKKINMERED